MANPVKQRYINKVDVLVKTSDLGTTKLEFLNSRAEIKNNFLLIKTTDTDSITTKIFNINEISAFKEYYNITT